MSDEIENLAAAVGELIKVQRTDHRRLERLEQAFVEVSQVLLRADEREDNWQDWRNGIDQWRREAEAHRHNMADNLQALGELTLENARHSGENRRDIAELRQAQAETRDTVHHLVQTVNTLAATVAKLVERNGHDSA